MKKLFLLLVCAVALAGTSFGYEFKKYPGIYFSTMSPNGHYLICNNDGSVYIYNAATEEMSQYDPNDSTGVFYTIGIGNAANDLGMVVGATTNYDPAVWQNGTWTTLPMKEGVTKGVNSFANGITPDGKYICGSISISKALGESDNTTYFPCVWTKGDDGKYGEYELLPYPKTDFTGRYPQYVTAIAISDDGKTIAGQITGFDGFTQTPIVYTKDDSGQWSYKVYGLEKLLSDPNPKFPKWVYEPKEPKPDDYISADSLASYNDALEAYKDSLEMYQAGLISKYPTQPKKTDYLSDKEGYDAAVTKYDSDYAIFADSAKVFNEYYYSVWTGATYTFNVVLLSANGKYLALTLTSEDPDADPLDWMTATLSRPTLIDLSNNGAITETSAKKTSAFGVFNDGTMIGGAPAIDFSRNAYVFPAGSTDAVKFQDWIATKCDTASIWLKENMSYDVTITTYDDQGNAIQDVVEDSLVTGSMLCNPDGTVFTAYVYDMWQATSVGYTSYVLDITNPDKPTGIAAPNKNNAEGVEVKAANGHISVSGNAESMYIYDMAGRKIYDAKGDAEVNVNKGLYMVKVTDAKGNVVTKKVSVEK